MVIYMIENKINNKKYIGSTKNFTKRIRDHFYSATCSTTLSYNYPLQKAIRKYGQENFNISILEECSLELVSDKELYWIQYYNSMVNTGHGYNQTLYTDCALRDPNIIKENIERTGVRCALVDDKNNIIKIFMSYHEAARQELDKNEASPIRMVCNGSLFSINGKIFRDLDEKNQPIIPVQKTRKRKTPIYGVLINDKTDIVYYESVSEAARHQNCSRQSISKCINGSTKYTNVNKRIWRKVGDF